MSKSRWSYPKKRGNNNKPYRAVEDEDFCVDASFDGSHRKKAHAREDQDSVGERSGFSENKRQRHPPGLKGKDIGLWYRDHKHLNKRPHNQEPEEEVEIILKRAVLDEVENNIHLAGVLLPDSNETFSDKEQTLTFEDKINKAGPVLHLNDEELNMKLYDELLEKDNSPHYREMQAFREKLPTYKMKKKIVNLINKNQIVVISGGTGCGKTTQIVQYVLDDCILQKKGSLCNIICTQPRRISAISVAERVASERDELVGNSVGYQIRLEKMISKKKQGCINFLTTGVLLSWLASEPSLNSVTHLFLDEIHERNIDSDLMMALLKYILPKRPDIKIILMSATLNQDIFSAYFNGAPCLEIPGLTYPVEEIFLEDILEKVRFTFPPARRPSNDPVFRDYIIPYINSLSHTGKHSSFVLNSLKNPMSEEVNVLLAAAVVEYICKYEEDGAILVFLPGLSDIDALYKEIKKKTWFSQSRYIVIPMHSILPTVHQLEAFRKPREGIRKIVIATSILETSITIDDIVYVVDCGKNKFPGYDIKHKVATLEPTWITLANANQRKGRAGRTRPGKCYKLYTKVRQDIFEQYPTPEIKTTSLECLILTVKLLKLGKAAPFLEKLMDPPESDMVVLSLKILSDFNALDSEERLTPLGYHLAKLPMDPRAGKMILMAAIFSCVDPVFSVAACLCFKDPFMFPLGQKDTIDSVKKYFANEERSDHLVYSEVFKQWEDLSSRHDRFQFENKYFLSSRTMKLLGDMKGQFSKLLHSMNFLSSLDVKDPRSNVNSHNKELIKAIVCAGLYPNIAILKTSKTSHSKIKILKTADHNRVEFHKKSCCSMFDSFDSRLFVYHQILKTKSIFIHDATMIQPIPLLFFGKNLESIRRNNSSCVKVDDMTFKISERAVRLIKVLRKHWESILTDAISNPRIFDWKHVREREKILNAIAILLSSKH